MSSPSAIAEKPHTQSATVFVNAQPKTVTSKTLTFEEVVELAFPNPWSNPNTFYTVGYRKGEENKPKGSLVQGGDPVKVKDGMVFDVTPTDKS